MKKIINRLIESILAKTPENPKKETDKSLVELFGIIAALSIIFLIWLNYPSFINWMDNPSYKVQIPLLPYAMIPETLNPNDFNKIGERFGTYGDAYGSLNTLFSGFAFAILIISLFMQRQELKEQRKELAAQREEISKSNDIAEQQALITEQQAELLEKQIREAQVQNFFNILFPLFNRKKTYYEVADTFPEFGTPPRFENGKSESIFKTLHIAALKIYDNFQRTYKSDFLHKDEILKILKRDFTHNDAYFIAYTYLNGTKYKEYVLYIINFIENFVGIEDKDREIALSIFLSDFSRSELYIISILTIEDDVLLEKAIKYKIFNSFIENDHDGYSVFSKLFSE